MDGLEEYFVPVEGYPNYAVSNYGKVINVNKDRYLKEGKDANGYLKVKLYRKGLGRTFYIHRLVAQAFFLMYKDGVEINHLNGFLWDNSVLNLTIGKRKARKPNDNS